MSEKTELQKQLTDKTHSRGIAAVDHVLQGTVDFNRLAVERATALPNGETFVLADIACGGATWLHEMVAGLPAHFEAKGLSTPVQGIGLDVNPLGESKAANVRILKGDATRMTEIPDASVDLGTSFFGGHYIADMLAALESSHRILKPGASFYWLVPHDMVSNPSIDKILANTPGADALFELRGGGWSSTSPLIVCKRSMDPSESFTGFPYRFVGAEEIGWNGFVEKWNLPRALKVTSNLAHFRRGKYEKT